MVASSSAGFFSSITPSGRPLTNSTTSGRRVFRFSVTLNWLTASQSLLAGILEVDDPDLIPAHPALGIAILDLDAVHEHPVEGAVAVFQRGPLGPRQLAEGVINRIDGQTGIEHGERVPQPSLQHHLSVVATLSVGRVGRNVWSVGHLPAEAGKPLKRGLFNVGFAEGCHGMLRVTPTSSVHPSVQGLDPRILAQYQAKGP